MSLYDKSQLIRIELYDHITEIKWQTRSPKEVCVGVITVPFAEIDRVLKITSQRTCQMWLNVGPDHANKLFSTMQVLTSSTFKKKKKKERRKALNTRIS